MTMNSPFGDSVAAPPMQHEPLGDDQLSAELIRLADGIRSSLALERNRWVAVCEEAAQRLCPTSIPSFQDYERRCLEHALRVANGSKIEAAKMLGVGKSTLYRKLQEHRENGKS
jgi:DNA-binding NtrC family response regulator